MPRPRRKKADVHFTFKAHPPGEKYMPRPLAKRVKTFVGEAPTGWTKGMPVKPSFPPQNNKVYNKTRYTFISDALKKGKNVVGGEEIKNLQELSQLQKLESQAQTIEVRLLKHPEMRNTQNIMEFFQAFAEETKFRHKLIGRTIKEALAEGATPLEARYGTAHSLITRELQKQGINSTRDITPQVFSWNETVLRKLLSGNDPKTISNKEYKKATISMLSDTSFKIKKRITGKPIRKLTDSDARFYSLVENALLDNLTEAQLDELLRTNKRGNIFTLNGLPEKPTRKQLLEFLEKHSEFWKRQKAIARIRMETRKKRKP